MELGAAGGPDQQDSADLPADLDFEPAEFDPADWDWLPAQESGPDQPPAEPDPIVELFIDLADAACSDFARLDQCDRIDALVSIEGQLSWLAAQQQVLLADLAANDTSAERWHIEEVSAALRWPAGLTRARLRAAAQLCHRLPATLTALRNGLISADQARVIADQSYLLPDQRLAGYEQRVLQRAPEQSLPQTRQSAKRAAQAADPATAEVRHQRALADRHVRIAPADDGMAWLLALLPAAEAHAVQAQLDAAARGEAGRDGRTRDQRRADELVARILDGPAKPVRCLQPAVSVIVGLNTLVGTDDEPGWLDGYGPISAGYARRLAHDPTGTWRRLVTDPVTGQPLDYGTTRYRPPKHLVDHVIARDGTCTFPGCNQRAARSDLDHIKPFGDGPTSAQNLQPLHRRHHNAKTHGGWRSERDEDGWTIWTSPTGRTYRSRPPQRWRLPDDPPF